MEEPIWINVFIRYGWLNGASGSLTGKTAALLLLNGAILMASQRIHTTTGRKRVRAAALESAGVGIEPSSPSSSNTLSVPSGLPLSFVELPQPSVSKAFENPCTTRKYVSAETRPAAVTIHRGTTVIELTNDAGERLLSFVSEVIRNAE